MSFEDPNPPHVYGDRVIAQLTIDESVLPPGFTGTLDASQFTALIGTESSALYTLSPAGAWEDPFPGGSAFVTFSQGQIVNWSFGHTYPVLGNFVVISSTGQRDRVVTFPRAIPPIWPQVASSGPGTWTLQQEPSPVPLPAGIYLLGAGIAALAAAARRRHSIKPAEAVPA